MHRKFGLPTKNSLCILFLYSLSEFLSDGEHFFFIYFFFIIIFEKLFLKISYKIITKKNKIKCLTIFLDLMHSKLFKVTTLKIFWLINDWVYKILTDTDIFRVIIYFFGNSFNFFFLIAIKNIFLSVQWKCDYVLCENNAEGADKYGIAFCLNAMDFFLLDLFFSFFSKLYIKIEII